MAQLPTYYFLTYINAIGKLSFADLSASKHNFISLAMMVCVCVCMLVSWLIGWVDMQELDLEVSKGGKTQGTEVFCPEKQFPSFGKVKEWLRVSRASHAETDCESFKKRNVLSFLHPSLLYSCQVAEFFIVQSICYLGCEFEPGI